MNVEEVFINIGSNNDEFYTNLKMDIHKYFKKKIPIDNVLNQILLTL